MISQLERSRRVETGARMARHPQGWTPARRARQSALIRGWQPWRRSTGPRTQAGKARTAQNARRHGFSSHETLLKLRRVRHALHLVDRNLAFLRLLCLLKRARHRAVLKVLQTRRDARAEARHNPRVLPEPSP